MNTQQFSTTLTDVIHLCIEALWFVEPWRALADLQIRWLTRFAKRERLADPALREAIDRAERGLIDADLGGGLIKQRIARKGEGRRGGYRMVVGYRSGERAILLYGFAKNDLDNIDQDQLIELRALGEFWLSAAADTIEASLEKGTIMEVANE